ncbi:disease resistance protein (CC-NBS-LRR class) family protein, partial [Trifolium medium]|nr:disease resistance protein (CC-NBS-LRR class) family protein [Trifolium medium]
SLNDEAVMKVSSTIEEQFPNDDVDEIIVSKSRLSSIASQFPSKGFPHGTEVQATSGHMNQTAEGKQDFVEHVSGLKIPSIANSYVLMNGSQSMSQQCSMDQLGEIDTIVKPSQGIKLSVEDKTPLLPNAKTITSSLECGDDQIAIPFSISTTEEPLTIEEDVDIESSQKKQLRLTIKVEVGSIFFSYATSSSFLFEVELSSFCHVVEFL